MREFRRKADAMLARRGVTAELLDAAALRAEEPHSPGGARRLLIPSHGFVAAPELTRALAGAARRHGAQIIEHGAVRRIAAAERRSTVETDCGSLTGDAVVLAAGSWSGSIDIDGVARPCRSGRCEASCCASAGRARRCGA